MNFRIEFLAGQSSKNKGLPMGAGLVSISTAIGGIQKAMTYSVAAAPKAGKI